MIPNEPSYFDVSIKCVNPFPNKPLILCVCLTSLLKTAWEKKKLLVTSNFFFSHSVFYPFGEFSTIFTKFKIVVCKLFQFGRVFKFVDKERVNMVLGHIENEQRANSFDPGQTAHGNLG